MCCYLSGVYILSQNFIIAPKHNKCVVKIFINVLLNVQLHAMEYLTICLFCALQWIN